MAIKLDDLVEDGIAAFGLAVWKIVKDEDGKKDVEEVDLRNWRFNQTVKYLRETPIVELHHLSPLEIKIRLTFGTTPPNY